MKLFFSYSLVRNQAKKDRTSFIPPQMEEIRDLCSLCKYVITNPNNAKALKLAVRNPEVYTEIAIASCKEFGETSMLYENMYTLAPEGTDETIADTIADTM